MDQLSLFVLEAGCASVMDSKPHPVCIARSNPGVSTNHLRGAYFQADSLEEQNATEPMMCTTEYKVSYAFSSESDALQLEIHG